MKRLAWLMLIAGLYGCVAHGGAASMSTEHLDQGDKAAITELVGRWALYRDQHRWKDLGAVFKPGATISLSWFSGPHEKFVVASQKLSADANALVKHQLGVPLVTVSGNRATSEVSVTILVRSQSPFGELDTTSYARFFDLLEQNDGRWQIARRTAIYEKDRVDPVSGASLPPQFFEGLDEFPPQLKFLAKALKQVGRQVAPGTVCDGSEEMEATYEAGREWLTPSATP